MVATPVRKILSAKPVLDASWLCQLQSAGQHPFPASQPCRSGAGFDPGSGEAKHSSAQHTGAWAVLFESPDVSAGIRCFTSQFRAFVQHLQRSKTNTVFWYSTYQGPVLKLLLKQTEKSPPIISRGSIFTID